MSRWNLRAFYRETAIALMFVAQSVGLTWPLARLLPIAVGYPGDPLINSWILSWDIHALTHAPARLFDANIFFPARHALAFSENCPWRFKHITHLQHAWYAWLPLILVTLVNFDRKRDARSAALLSSAVLGTTRRLAPKNAHGGDARVGDAASVNREQRVCAVGTELLFSPSEVDPGSWTSNRSSSSTTGERRCRSEARGLLSPGHSP